MTAFFLFMAGVSNWMRYLSFRTVTRKLKLIVNNIKMHSPQTEILLQERIQGINDDVEMEECTVRGSDSEQEEGELDQEPLSTPTTGVSRSKPLPKRQKCLFLDAGCAHNVWKPRSGSVVERMRPTKDIQKRQHKLLHRVWATHQVLKVHRKQSETAMIVEEEKETDGVDQSIFEEQKKWQKVIARVMEDNKKAKQKGGSNVSLHFHSVVTQYVAAMSKADHHDAVAQCDHALTKATSSPQLRIRSRKWKKTALKPGLFPNKFPRHAGEEKQQTLHKTVTAALPN
jgi:hypothetical protein